MSFPFHDRKEAGQRLASLLKPYQNAPDTIVIALPRGGVVVGYEVAKALHLPLDIVCPRKIGAPFNPEYAIGAITETGERIFHQQLLDQFDLTEATLAPLIEKEKKEAQRRLDSYRKNRPIRQLAGKTVILVDDGLATGSTMWAALKTVQAEKAKEILIAIPVAPPGTLKQFQAQHVQILSLLQPTFFSAVGQFYEDFSPVSDQEVQKLLNG